MAEFNPEKIKSDQIHNGLQYMLGDALSADDVNALVEGLLYLSGFSGEVNFGKLLKATKANFGIVTSDSAEIGALSVNTLQSELQKALTVGDNILIVNAYGDETTVSGVVVLKGSDVIEETQNAYPAYGLLYDPVTNAMCVGDVTVLEGDSDTGHEVTYNPETLIPLAARDGFFLNDEIPIWDAIKNAFVPSGIRKSDVGAGGGGITEYDYEITDPSQFTTDNLATMSGAVLVNCDILVVGGASEPIAVSVPETVNVLNFNGHKVDVDLDGHSECRLMNAHFVVGGNYEAGYEQYAGGFGSVEFCRGAGVYSGCNRIAHSDIWRASGCQFITDVQTHPYEYENTVFSNCKNITNVRVSDIYNDYAESNVEFDSCSYISNVSFTGDRDGVIKYYNCKYVDALTCHGYKAFYYDDEAESDYQSDATYGVPYISANGIVTFLDSAEGGSYGS
jgi:hypothetical protein